MELLVPKQRDRLPETKPFPDLNSISQRFEKVPDPLFLPCH